MRIESLAVGPIGVNCYLLCDEAQALCAVIDPGGEARRISAAVERTLCAPCAILLTHGHFDHTGAAEELAAAWKVPLYLNRRDLADQSTALMRQIFPAVAGTQDLDEGDTVSVGGLTVKVLATPGHSEGSLTFRCGGVLFTGDTLFAGSMGRTDFPGGSERKIMASLRRLGQLEGDFAVYPGHMDSSTLAQERQSNPFLRQALAQAL